VVYSNIYGKNIAAIGLYESLGFELYEDGTLNFYSDFREHTNKYRLKF